MPRVKGAERELFDEDGIGKSGARLKARSKVEVYANVGVVSILAVGSVLDCQDVEGHHHTIDRQQHRL